MQKRFFYLLLQNLGASYTPKNTVIEKLGFGKKFRQVINQLYSENKANKALKEVLQRQ